MVVGDGSARKRKQSKQEETELTEEEKLNELREKELMRKYGCPETRLQPTFLDYLVESDVYDAEKLDAFLARGDYEAGDDSDPTSEATPQPQPIEDNKDDKTDQNGKKATSQPQHTEDCRDDQNDKKDTNNEEEGGKKPGLITKARRALKRLSQ